MTTVYMLWHQYAPEPQESMTVARDDAPSAPLRDRHSAPRGRARAWGVRLGHALCLTLAAIGVIAGPSLGLAQEKTSQGLVYISGGVSSYDDPNAAGMLAMSLVNPGEGDLFLTEQEPHQEVQALFPDDLTFFVRRKTKSLYQDYLPIGIDEAFGKIDASGFGKTKNAFRKDPYTMVMLRDGDCIVNVPMIFPLQRSLKRAMLVVVMNPPPRWDLDEGQPWPPTMLIKMRIVDARTPPSGYEFRVVKTETLDKYYCNAHDDGFRQKFEEFVSEKD